MIWYFYDMLLVNQSIERLNIASKTLIFLLQQLGFTIKLKNIVLSLTQKTDIFGLEIEILTQKSKSLMSNRKITLWEIASLISLLFWTAQAVTPILEIRYPQRQRVNYTNRKLSYQSPIYQFFPCSFYKRTS